MRGKGNITIGEGSNWFPLSALELDGMVTSSPEDSAVNKSNKTIFKTIWLI